LNPAQQYAAYGKLSFLLFEGRQKSAQQFAWRLTGAVVAELISNKTVVAVVLPQR
jgi:hypothetical protein